MYSTFHSLEVGKRAILANQTALSTTGHNIAHANTKGYTRQEAILKATRPLAYSGLQTGTIGTGVEVSQFQRIRDAFLDVQYRDEQQNAGYWQAKSDALTNLETVFNETADAEGLNMALNRFWQSLQELAKEPDNLSLRTVAITTGKSIADHLNSISTGISQQEKIVHAQMTGTSDNVNSLANELAELNRQIAKIVGSGNQPNDLYDQRDVLLDDLSKLVNIQTTSSENGMVDVSVNGISLLTGTTANTFSIDTDTGKVMIGSTNVEINGGQLSGLIDMNEETIPSLRTKLNELTLALAENLNAIHSSDEARNLNDMKDPAASPEKLLFFVDKNNPSQPPSDAANITINPLLLTSPERFAAATSNQRDDGSNAAAMAEIFSKEIEIDGKTTKISDYYKMLLTGLGTDVQTAQRCRENADVTTLQWDNQRQSVSGVSLDEELTNMVRYQQAYNAAARYVSAVNEMLDKLINGMV